MTTSKEMQIKWVLDQFRSMGATRVQLLIERVKLTYDYRYLYDNLQDLNFTAIKKAN